MNRLSPRLQSTLVLCSFFVCLALLVLLSSYSTGSQAATTSQGIEATATPTPTCSPTGCAQARRFGYQPYRYDMRPTFVAAASNSLGTSAPYYDLIYHGIPATREPVTTARPIPHVIQRGMAWQESHWIQFGSSVNAPENSYACTLVGSSCGYGVMQITSCMNVGLTPTPPPGQCGWFDPPRVAGELRYNIGTGTNFLIQKWNYVQTIGDNDHTVTEQWYYGIGAYNYWTRCNDPNRIDTDPDPYCHHQGPYDPSRPPFGDIGTPPDYPYQESAWGWMVHPERARPVPTPWLWRPTNLAAVPRGIFGLSGSWAPPSLTTLPLVHLLPDIRVAGGVGPSIVLRNTDPSQTLAVDIMFYNQNGTFNTRWLDPSPYPPYYLYPYVRLGPNASRTLQVSSLFPAGFTGYARINASEGIEITLQPPPYPNKVYLPVVLKNAGGVNCYDGIYNGDFEAGYYNGKPLGWSVSSADAYNLADGTWFQSGHYAAYLGGYEYANDVLSQVINIPGWTSARTLSFGWYMHSEEIAANDYDHFYVRLRDINTGNVITTVYSLDNYHSTEDTWQTASISLSGYSGLFRLSFEADTDVNRPTSFFIDNVSLWLCGQSDCGGNPTPTPTPTNTPDPTTDTWTFSGDVSDPGSGQPVPCTDTTLYHMEGNDWQYAGSATTGDDGQFTLEYAGPPDPGLFMILVRYPPGYTPILPQPGPHFAAAQNQALVSVEAIPPGIYGGHHFVGIQHPNVTPMPQTPTPPTLPTVPIPGTPTPMPSPTVLIPTVLPSPTIVSPLATPTP